MEEVTGKNRDLLETEIRKAVTRDDQTRKKFVDGLRDYVATLPVHYLKEREMLLSLAQSIQNKERDWVYKWQKKAAGLL